MSELNIINELHTTNSNCSISFTYNDKNPYIYNIYGYNLELNLSDIEIIRYDELITNIKFFGYSYYEEYIKNCQIDLDEKFTNFMDVEYKVILRDKLITDIQ